MVAVCNLQGLQILIIIDRKGMIDDIKMHT